MNWCTEGESHFFLSNCPLHFAVVYVCPFPHTGNVTTTSVRGLEPGTEYVFSIAAIAEDIQYANAPTDLYGRREPVDEALVGQFSTYTNITATLAFDFDFGFFSANSTLNHTGSPS